MDWSKFWISVAIFTFVLAINSLAVMLCWNAFLINAFYGVKEIDFITAIGLTGLFGILFKENGFKVNRNE
jgi:hypothetical protein